MATLEPTRQETANGVDAIANLSREELIARWTKTYKRPPPKGISRTLLERSAAYQVQVKGYGGLSTKTRRALREAFTEGKEPDAAKSAKTKSNDLKPGVRLVREWNGRIHTVEVIEGGFVWEGRVYKSLSAVARRITGARWSGPRFFGL